MRAVLTIVRKELTGLFASPIAFIALTAVALAMSLFFLDRSRSLRFQLSIREFTDDCICDTCPIFLLMP